MACVFKHPKSKFWTASYTGRDGKRIKRSTKTTDKSQAQKIALQLETAERKAGSGNVTTVQLRKIVNDLSQDVLQESIEVGTVEEYLKDWLEKVKIRNSAATLERYQSSVNHFLKSLGDRAKRSIASVTARQVEDFLHERLKAGVAPKTAIVDLKILNSAFRRAEKYGTILHNPVPAVQLPKLQSSEREIFTHEEVYKLLNAAPTQEWQTLILLGYFAGARLGDCLAMRWENINFEKGALSYIQKKTGKRVTVPLHGQVVIHLANLDKPGEGFLCPTLAAKTSGGKTGLSETFKRIVIAAGLDTMNVEGKGIRKFNKRTFHSLRHSFNSVLANAGVAQEVRMALTGHSSKAMNSTYTHLNIGPLKEAINKIPAGV
jgi:integrase